MCLPVKRDALLKWTMVKTHTFPGERLPSVLVRRLNHIKIVYVSEQPPQAKGYLLFGKRGAAFIQGLKKKQGQET
jgi:hypothetical protein